MKIEPLFVMNRFFLFIFLVIVQFIAFENSNAGGWTSTGGGSGVVCFVDADSATKADLFFAEKRHLSDELIDKIKSVEVLDLYEAHPENKKEMMNHWLGMPDPKMNWQSLHEEIVNQIKTLTPLFGFVLKDLDLQTSFKTWKKVNYLDLIPDQSKNDSENFQRDLESLTKLKEKVFSKDSKCRLIQIMRRNSRSSDKDSDILNGTFPLPSTFFDFEFLYVDYLFEKMDFLNKALLYLHEKLYLIGSSIGHQTSDSIRYWVRAFALLEPKFIYENSDKKFVPSQEETLFPHECKESDENKKQCHIPPYFMRMRLTQSFGDYALYFIADRPLISKKGKNPFSFWFINTLKRSRQLMEECSGDHKDRDKLDECYNLLIEAGFPYNKLSDGENFLYLAWWYLSSYSGALNMEYLVNPSQDSESLKQNNLIKIEICNLLPQIQNLIKLVGDDERFNLRERLPRALNYCHKNLNIPRK